MWPWLGNEGIGELDWIIEFLNPEIYIAPTILKN